MSEDDTHGVEGLDAAELPRHVSAEMWAHERRVGQNPRIRAYLGCTRMIEEVLDSNYALLNCSPERLRKIWSHVRETCATMRSELAPTLLVRSSIPELELARVHAEAAFRDLSDALLSEIDSFPDRFSHDQLPAVRDLLCRSIGRVYAFLRDSFGELMAADPRSRHEADYFLSKRFAQDIEASEWLYSSVYELCDYLDGLEKVSVASLEGLMTEVRQSKLIPSEQAWGATERVLTTLRDELSAKLREVVSLRAIRVTDLQALDAFAKSISYDANTLLVTCALGRQIVESVKGESGPSLEEREQSVKDLLRAHEAVTEQMLVLTATVLSLLGELRDYVPAWLSRIEKRRALMWSKIPDEREDGAVRDMTNPEYFRRRFDD